METSYSGMGILFIAGIFITGLAYCGGVAALRLLVVIVLSAFGEGPIALPT